VNSGSRPTGSLARHKTLEKQDNRASKISFLVQSVYYAFRRGFVDRTASEVLREYSSGWAQYRNLLAVSSSLDDWLNLEGLDVRQGFSNVDDRLTFTRFKSSEYYRNILLTSLREHLPAAGSITEYGCGMGRNLLFLKQQFPQLECYGYELVTEGVEVAQEAAKKFGVNVQYAQLDYLRSPSSKYVFPTTDAAFTMFSLEQLPAGCGIALRNILAHTKMGSIHIEPVTEHYPYTVRGLIGRLDHWKAGYLRDFPAAVGQQTLASVVSKRLFSSHNPLMFPSVVVLKKS